MGQRANLITVEDGEYTLRYDHWCANRLDDILFWGPGHALDYFDAQETIGEEGWLDDVWAEGGAVLDLDKKYLLWWGGEDILYDLPLRRVYLKLQNDVWNNWTIEWAYRGIVDLAEYVGYPKEKVLAGHARTIEPAELLIAKKGEGIRTIGAIETADQGIKLFVAYGKVENYLFNGPDLVRQCKERRRLETVVWEKWTNNFPSGGFFINEKERIVEFWHVYDRPMIVRDLKGIWDDWEIVWHHDNYEFMLDRLDDKIVFPEIDEADLTRALRKSLLREGHRSGLSAALDANETLRGEGMKVQINPWLFKSHHIEQPLESKLQIWQKNFGE